MNVCEEALTGESKSRDTSGTLEQHKNRAIIVRGGDVLKVGQEAGRYKSFEDLHSHQHPY